MDLYAWEIMDLHVRVDVSSNPNVQIKFIFNNIK